MKYHQLLWVEVGLNNVKTCTGHMVGTIFGSKLDCLNISSNSTYQSNDLMTTSTIELKRTAHFENILKLSSFFWVRERLLFNKGKVKIVHEQITTCTFFFP